MTAPSVPDHEMFHCIGEGSYGEVWLARNALGFYRAVKVVYRDRFENEKPFDREFAGIRRFEPVSRTHDGFVDILQVGRSDAGDWFYCVMELADDATPLNEAGQLRMGDSDQRASILNPSSSILAPETYTPLTLASRIHAAGRLAVFDCVRLGLALTAALDHLHRHGLVHRDIKPSNIIFVNGQPKLADVGLVAETSEAHSFVGTQGFMPPEGPGSLQADLYALGKVLYAASTGHGATAWPNPLTDLGALPDQQDWLELNEVINTACHSDPKCRYASAAEMQADLALLQIGKSLQRQRKLEKRLKHAAWALAGIAVVALAVLFFQQMRIKAAQRATLLLQLEKEIRPPHTEGWSSNAWQMAGHAAAKFGFDNNLQSQAAASLAGLDAKCIFETNGVGGSSVAFDREGKRVLFGSLTGRTDDPGKAHLLDLATTNLSAFPVPGEGPVAFLPDGTPVQFSADASNRLALWSVGQASQPAGVGDFPVALRYFDLPDGEQFTSLDALAMTPYGAFVSASGVTKGDRAFCAIWKGTSGQLLFQTNRAATALALAPDGSLLVAGNDSGEVTVWRVSDGHPLPTINAGRRSIRSLAFCREFVRDPLHPASEPQWLLAVGDSGGGVTIWEVPAQRLRTPCRGAAWDRTALAFSPDGTLLASGGLRRIVFWDTATGNPVTDLDEASVIGVGFSADGTKFAATRERGVWAPRTRVLEMEHGRGIRTLLGLSRQVASVCFSADANLVAAVAHDWQVGIWDLSRHRLLHIFQMPPGLATADNAGLAFSPDGSQFAFMAGTNAVLIDVASGTLSQKWRVPPGRVEALAFDSSSRLLAFHFESMHTDAKQLVRPTVARIRELLPDGNLRVLSTLKEFNYDVREATWSHDGSFVVIEGSRLANGLPNRFVEAVTPEGTQPLWSRPSEMPWNGGRGALLDTAGRYIAVADGRNRIMDFDLCEAQTGDLVRPLANAPLLLNSAADRICIEPGSGGLALLSLSEGATLLSLQHLASTRSFFPAFSLDGRLLVWGNSDGSVSVCDLAEMRQRLNELGLGW